MKNKKKIKIKSFEIFLPKISFNLPYSKAKHFYQKKYVPSVILTYKVILFQTV